MSYPRYHNVQRVEGEGMGFDTYLKQIRLLYPNLPDLYVYYLRVIYRFNKEQLDRMLQLGHYDIAYEIIDAYTQVLEQFKERDRDMFLQFVDGYGYTERMIELLEIEAGETIIETLGCHLSVVPDGFTGIYTVDDLRAIDNDPAGNYILMNDIDLAGIEWEPLCSETPYFTGILNGNHYKIQNLTINQPSLESAGLFNTIAGGTVVNLHFRNAAVIGGDNVGCLAAAYYGKVGESIIQNCSCDGSVAGTYKVGGLIGYISPNSIGISEDTDVNIVYLQNITSSCMVGLTADYGYAGGITGELGGGHSVTKQIIGDNLIYKGVITIDVAGPTIGGIAGRISGTTVNIKTTRCGVKGAISSTDNSSIVGGLYGQCTSMGMDDSIIIDDSYVQATIAGDTCGGLFGKTTFMGNPTAGAINRVYVANTITGTSYADALIGKSLFNKFPVLSECYYNTDVNTSSKAIGKTTAQLKDLSTYAAWDFDSIWHITFCDCGGVSYPVFKNNCCCS